KSAREILTQLPIALQPDGMATPAPPMTGFLLLGFRFFPANCIGSDGGRGLKGLKAVAWKSYHCRWARLNLPPQWTAYCTKRQDSILPSNTYLCRANSLFRYPQTTFSASTRNLMYQTA